MLKNKPIRRVAIIGTGVIGASWTALFLANGLDVVATDVAPGAEAALKRFVATAWPALQRLGLAAGASQNKLSFTGALTDARMPIWSRKADPKRLISRRRSMVSSTSCYRPT
jgi:3-hydroxyacyl-CoA dehydrogenase